MDSAPGFYLTLGAFCAIVLQPSLIFLIGNGFREMRGVRFDLGIENLTLALAGARAMATGLTRPQLCEATL